MPAHPHTAIPPAHRTPLGADSPLYHWWITAALMLGFMTAGLSVTVVQLAFPHIMTSLRADLDAMQWVQTSAMIMQAVMMPSVGWLGSRLGNRRLYLLALGTFVGGSILCGMAWDVYSLIVFRVVQAIGAGPLFPLTQSIMFQTFPEEKRGLAMGVNSLGFSFGPMIGPVIGGYLLEHASWRTVFYINVPVGLIGLVLAYLVLPYPRQQEQRSLDVLGLFSMATFLVTFLLAITQGRTEGWDSQYIVTLLHHRRSGRRRFCRHGTPPDRAFRRVTALQKFCFCHGLTGGVPQYHHLHGVRFRGDPVFANPPALYAAAGSLDPHALRGSDWHFERGDRAPVRSRLAQGPDHLRSRGIYPVYVSARHDHDRDEL